MSAAEQIPAPLRYGASQSQARVVRNTIMPQGVSTGGPGSIVRFVLPERSIVDLRSLSLYYTYTISGLLNGGAGDFANAQIPASYKHWKSVRFYVSGAAASGSHNQHYDQVYHALVCASGSEDWVNSRLNNNYLELLDSTELASRAGAGVSSKSAYITCDDFLGLPNSKNYCIDTSLYGSVHMEVQFNDNNQLKISRATQTDAQALASIHASFENIKLKVDTVTSISPLYVSLLAERISGSDAPIRVPFQDIRTIVASNTGSNRITVNSMCVDALMVCPFSADPNTNVSFANDALVANNARYKFDSGRSEANANQTRYSCVVGSEVFPRQPIEQASELADVTTNSIYGNSARSTNLLYRTMTAGGAATTPSRLAFLSNNCVALQRFSLMTEGWSEGVLTGLNTAGQSVDFVVNTQNFGTHLLIAALCTSCLVFDPKTSAVQVES
jgi:hypothetical protein